MNRNAVLWEIGVSTPAGLLQEYAGVFSASENQLNQPAMRAALAWIIVAGEYACRQKQHSEMDRDIVAIYQDYEAGAFHVAWDVVLVDLAKTESIEAAATKALEFEEGVATRLARPHAESAEIVRSYLGALLAKTEGKIDSAVPKASLEWLETMEKDIFFDKLVLGDKYTQDRHKEVVLAGAKLFGEVYELI